MAGIFPQGGKNFYTHARDSGTINGKLGHGLLETSSTKKERIAGAVIVPCSRKKTLPHGEKADAASLLCANQPALQTAWQGALAQLTPEIPAQYLYAGRGFSIARRAAGAAAAPMFVISAGLGLVAASEPIPSYALTISPDATDAITAKAIGTFSHADWWRSISSGPFTTPLEQVFQSAGEKPVLLACSAPYAELIKGALVALPEEALKRLRIFGAQLKFLLPPKLADQVMPFDDRFNNLYPGTRTDFPQRAMAYFMERILPLSPLGTTGDHANLVSDLMISQPMQPRAKREQKSDEELISLIRSSQGGGTKRPLSIRRLRYEFGIACEQSRFTRLVRASIAEAAE